jgi:hypothetical protein
MSNHQKATFGIYLKTSGIFWYVPLIAIFITARDMSLGAIGWLLIFSIFPAAYAWLGYLQAEKVALEIATSKFAAFRMSFLSLLGGAALQGLVLAPFSGGVGVIGFTVTLILLFGFLPALFVAALFIGLCENGEENS